MCGRSLLFFGIKGSRDTLHITRIFDLTYFSRSQWSNFDNFYDVLKLFNYSADQIFIIDMSNDHLLPGFSISTFQDHRDETTIIFTICSNTYAMHQRA
jgi:hypothetical protein